MAESSVMTPAATRGGALRRFWDSSVGKKVVMAVTGLLMIAFLISHVASNLSVFTGDPEKLNGYARFLRSFGPLLWVARIGLLALLVLHVTAALQLTRRQAVARPEGYRDRQPQVSTVSSRPGPPARSARSPPPSAASSSTPWSNTPPAASPWWRRPVPPRPPRRSASPARPRRAAPTC